MKQYLPLPLAAVLLVVWWACTPGERAAVATFAEKANGPLDLGCGMLEGVASDPWVDFACVSAEAGDALLEKIPQAKVVASNAVILPDGGTQVVSLRIRCPLSAFAGADGGARAIDSGADVR